MRKNVNPDKPRISEARLREMTAAGMNFVAISKATGIPAHLLRTTASVLGVTSGRAADGKRCFELIKCGRTCSEIAKEIGVSRQAVRQALARDGFPSTPADYLRSIAEVR